MRRKENLAEGILESYAIGMATAAESLIVEQQMEADPALRTELQMICMRLEAHAMENAVPVSQVAKAFLMAAIDYSERLKNGEPFTEAPLLNESSVIADFAQWLERKDMVCAGDENIFAKIISHTPGAATTAIVWIREYAPQEVHDNEYENFLILEGSCDITVEEEVTKLVAGDFFAMPLHKIHKVEVTSPGPCKIIVQRIAA